MTLPAEEKDLLIELLRDLTPGHLSTLVASLSEPNSQIATSTDSKNYVFLQKLCEFGLAKKLRLDLDMPSELQAVLTSFSINENAKTEIAGFLEAMPSNMDRDT